MPFVTLLTLSTLFATPGSTLARGASMSPELARAAATSFIARLQAGDVAGAVALCDAPFITHEQKTLGSIAEVTKYFQAMIPGTPPEQQPNAIISVRSYAETRGETADEVLEVRDQVLKQDGYVVFVGRNGRLGGVLLVRVKDNVARVVGVG